VAIAEYSATSFTLDLNLTDGKNHRVALYFADWDNSGRGQTVELLDADSGALLNTRTLSAFDGGIYLIWDIKGHITIRITRSAGPNAILMGFFLDPAPPTDRATLKPLGLESATKAFRLLVSGSVARSYVIEASADGKNWIEVGTILLPSSGSAEFKDTHASSACQLYRATMLN
jgi:hypothetical protein